MAADDDDDFLSGINNDKKLCFPFKLSETRAVM